MSQKFATKTARVLVAEESGALRQLLSDTLRASGFKNITVFASGMDLFNALEREHCDWIVMPTFLRQEVNAYHLLKTVSEVRKLHHVRISLFLDAEDEKNLRDAFQLGLLSWHPKVYVHDQVAQEFSSLQECFKRNQWSQALVAEEYLRKYLFKQKSFNDLIDVHQALLRLYPGSTDLLLKYGETQIRAGRVADGIATLKQACLVDERAKTYLDAIQKTPELAGKVASIGASGQNVLGINSCVVIDSDSVVLGNLKNMMEEAGVPAIHAFECGQAAWEWLSTNKEPDLIIQEWRIPRIAGPILLQRIRHRGFFNVPICVVSSVIKPEESHLVREFGVANVIAKPFTGHSFFKSIIWTLQQSLNPTEQNFLDRKIRNLLGKFEFREAEQLRRKYNADPRIKTVNKKTLDAEFAFARGEFYQARDFAIEALRLSGDSLSLLNLIGKCLLKIEDYSAAMQVFEKAHSLSPLNLEHLCNLAMSQYYSGNKEDCAKSLNRAQSIDKESEHVKQTQCQISILDGDSNGAKAIMEHFPSIDGIISYMNNRAVALAKTGRFADGIKLYEQTIESIPEKQQDVLDKVQYNLGLAYARYGELQQASSSLGEMGGRKTSAMHAKSLSLIRRIEQVEKDGSALSFYEATSENIDAKHEKSGAKAEDASDKTWDFEILTGDLCLYGIFQADKKSDSITIFLKNAPAFKDRSDG
ncbi:MAG: response regulator [Oligoflexales bacterium]